MNTTGAGGAGMGGAGGTGGTGQPGLFGFFALNEWNKAKPDELKKELTNAIAQDPEVTDASNIGVEPVLDGGKVVAIRLNGKAGSRKEAERAEQIVHVNTKDGVDVVNELVVD